MPSDSQLDHNDGETPSRDGEVAVPDAGQSTPSNQTNQEQPQRPRQSLFGTIKNMMMNMMIVYMISRYFMPGNKTTTSIKSDDPNNPIGRSQPSQNLFGRGFSMDLYVYISEDNYEPNFFNPRELKWVQKDIIYDDWTQGPNQDSTFQAEIDIDLSPKVQNNGSLWLHSYFVKSGFIPYEATRTAEDYSPIYTLHTKKQLNRYKKRRYRDTHNLITGKTDKSIEEQEKIKNKVKEEIVSHWHPNLTINMIYDHTAWTQGAVPAPLNEFIHFEPATGKYYPVVYINDYWNLLRDYQPINETVKQVHLSLTYQPIGMMKWQLYAAQGMQNKWSSMLGAEQNQNEDEQDYIKEALLETSPVLLGLTVVVSIAHSIFEFLAFKNDIQFWKDRKSLEGLSVRSVFFNLFQSVVVLLYVLDNDTSTLIKFSIGIGLLIELWKIPKVVNIKIDRENKILGVFPRVVFEDKGSYVESSTKQYDMVSKFSVDIIPHSIEFHLNLTTSTISHYYLQLAYRYLSWVIFPLFVAYAIYSLIYQEHKGWYSFILNMTYGFLLAFGFIMMTPQLFINYKLKSVAHLPWRMLSYKFLNTFIDDIFAFIIKMPLMYRLGCFRDDIIFIIYLYQRWIYRVDPKRVNEFGISGEDMQQNKSNDEQTKSIEASTESKSLPSTKKTTKSKIDKKKD